MNFTDSGYTYTLLNIFTIGANSFMSEDDKYNGILSFELFGI